MLTQLSRASAARPLAAARTAASRRGAVTALRAVAAEASDAPKEHVAK